MKDVKVANGHLDASTIRFFTIDPTAKTLTAHYSGQITLNRQDGEKVLRAWLEAINKPEQPVSVFRAQPHLGQR